MHLSEFLTNRRQFLTAGGAGAAALLLAGGEQAEAELSPDLRSYENKNEAIIMDFCAAWETLDMDKISSFFDDKIVFRMIDVGSQPFVEGKEAMVSGMGAFLSARPTAKFEVIRSAAMGNMVINERIDHFGKKSGPEDAFHITGVFIVKKGKIVEWRDYMMPSV